VDAHCHLWAGTHLGRSWPDAPRLFSRSFTVDDLAASCASSGVSSVVLIEAGTSPEEAALLESNAAASGLVGAFIAFADPGMRIERDLDRLMSAPKFRGVRMRFEGQTTIDPAAPSVIRSAREIARRGLVLELLVSTDHLEAARDLGAAVPDLLAMIDHMAKPDMTDRREHDRWGQRIRQIADDTQFLFKLSLSPRAKDLAYLAEHPAEAWPEAQVGPYVQTLVEVAGPTRLAWGSDWPIGVFGADQGVAIARIRQALGPIDGSTSDALFSATAQRFYGIG
jgi:L-fuconolactonase